MKFAINFIIRIAAAALGILSQVILGMYLPPESYGKYITLITLFNLSMLVSRWGFDSFLIKETARKTINPITKENKVYLQKVFSFSHILVVLTLVVLLVCFAIINYFFSLNLYVPVSGNIVIGIIVLISFMPLSSISISFLRGTHKILVAEFLENIIRPVLFIISFVVLFNVEIQSVDILALIFLVSYVGVYILALVIPKPNIGHLFISTKPISKNEIQRIFKQIGFINATALIGFAYFQLDTLLVAGILNNKEAGVYGMISNFTRGVTIVSMIVISHSQPVFAQLKEKNQIGLLLRTLKINLYKVLGISFIFWLGIALTGKLFLGLISKDYLVGYIPLLILCYGHIFNSAAMLIVAFFNMVGLHKIAMKYYFIGAFVAVALNWSLLPVLGISAGGISLSVGLSVFLGLVIFRKHFWKRELYLGDVK